LHILLKHYKPATRSGSKLKISEQASLELQLQTLVLNSKQEYAQMLNTQLRKQKALYQPIYRLAETAEKVNISQIDLALENMPLNQLQQLVQDLQRDLHKNFHFISDQEEEDSSNRRLTNCKRS